MAPEDVAQGDEPAWPSNEQLAQMQAEQEEHTNRLRAAWPHGSWAIPSP